MSKQRRQYTEHDFQNKEAVSDLITRFGDSYKFNDVDLNIDKIMHCKVAAANFWNAFSNLIRSALFDKYPSYENRKENEKKRKQIFSEFFNEQLLALLMAFTTRYYDRDTEQLCIAAYPKLSMVESIRIMGRQLYYKDTPSAQAKSIYDVMTSLPQPFNDERFEAIPIHTHGLKRGQAYSSWLKKIEGHHQKMFDEKNNRPYLKKLKTAYDFFFMDAKIGVLFTFKGKPSMRVCFNVDPDNNVFIHQIQAFRKDRGHYRLNDWRQAPIDYVKRLLPDCKVYVVTGDTAANDTLSSYRSDTPKCCLPDENTLDLIRSNYDQIKGLPVRRKKVYDKVFKRVV